MGFATRKSNKRRSVLVRIIAMVVLSTAASSLNAQLFPTYINGSFTLGNAGGSSPYDLADTFFLESNPTASKTIFLDFDGFHSVNNSWNHDIIFPAFDRDGNPNSFSSSELIEIQRQFQNVAEDFLPFDVNVTTRDPGVEALRKSNASDNVYGVRAVNTQATDGFGNGIGGIAFLNSFDDSIDNPVFAFNKGTNNGAMTNSHEVGHALGLHHDGLGSQTYHPGTGSGPTGWGPIMGAPFGKNLTQWSNGDYANSTTTEDDLSIITSAANGFGFRTDMVGDDSLTAAMLNFDSNGEAFTWGIIEQNTDVDFFEFSAAQGDYILSIEPFQGTPNLDILASLYDGNNNLLMTSNPLDDVNAFLSFSVTSPGTYYLSIDGVGKSGVYSDYGSLGFFTISGSFSAIPEPAGLVALLGLSLATLVRRRRK